MKLSTSLLLMTLLIVVSVAVAEVGADLGCPHEIHDCDYHCSGHGRCDENDCVCYHPEE